MKTYFCRLALSALLCSLLPLHTAAAQAVTPSDRPPPLAATGTQPIPRLLATFVHPQAERSLAVIKRGDAAALTLHVGQALGDGFDVQAIARDHIVVTRGNQRYALPLLGQSPAAKARTRAAVPLPGRVPAQERAASAAPGISPQLRAHDLKEVRAACADSTVMNALPDVQKAEMEALGVCNSP